ncbi:hypothetical protein L596_023566 [Steinernema carpocapsae]|uniref:Uncharacterized protein n=1 Tax=Steinernema carpocapsae TaxID=34508 RepID=A0A4U5ME13_STECR|nr:hypothetical protein L596_023566 [Steinernema carpocapsae]
MYGNRVQIRLLQRRSHGDLGSRGRVRGESRAAEGWRRRLVGLVAPKSPISADSDRARLARDGAAKVRIRSLVPKSEAGGEEEIMEWKLIRSGGDGRL